MTLIKTSLLSLIATVIRVTVGLVINKAVALYVGPSGLALIGQFQNFTHLVLTMAQGGVNQGVVKYTAEYRDHESKLDVLFSTAGKISLTASIAVAIGVIIFSKYFSQHLLKTDDYAYIFFIFGFTLILFVLNGLLLSILNGLGNIRAYIGINIIQSIYSLFFSTFFIIYLGLDGALIALVTNQSVIFFIVVFMLRCHPVIELSRFRHAFDKAEAKKLISFSFMTLTSALTVPASHLVVRNYIGENLSWGQAGYWQAIWYISSVYLMVVTTTLGVYYLPKLSSIENKGEMKKELLYVYKIVMPMVILSTIIIYFLKDVIIHLLFTEDFKAMRELFLWQLLGDIVKLAAWLLAYIMLAKAMTKEFVVTEILFSILFIVLSIVFINQFGLIGVTMAYFLNYVIYLSVVFRITKKKFN